MVPRIRSMEVGRDVRLNLLVYGLTDSGKTTLMGSAQDCELTSPLLALDINRGMVSLSGSDVKVVRPSSFTEIQDIYNYLRYDNKKYRCVGVDDLTDLQRKLSMDDILGMLDEKGSFSNLAEHTPADRYDWLSSGDQVRRFIRAFRDLAYLPEVEKRIHVIFTAQERTDDKRDIVCPALPGALGLEVGGSVDLMGRMFMKRVQVREGVFRKVHTISFRQSEDESGITYLAKARIPKGVKFPKEMYNPTIDKILSAWLGQPQTVSSRGEEE